MANTTAVSDPEFWAGETLAVLRNNFVMAGLVNRGFDPLLGSSGDTVNVQIPPELGVRSKSVGGNFTTDDVVLTNVAVVVNLHKYFDFVIERREQAQSALDLIKTFVTPAAVALANQVEVDLLGLVESASDAVGGTADTLSEATLLKARRKAWIKKFPMDGQWNLVVHPDQEKDVLGIADLRNANTVGDNGSAIKQAMIGERFGMRFFISQNVQASDAGTWNYNVLFHPNAIVLAWKPLASTFGGELPGARTATVTEGQYSLTVTQSYHADRGGLRTTIECLYGVKLVRQANIIRVNAVATTAASSSSSGS